MLLALDELLRSFCLMSRNDVKRVPIRSYFGLYFPAVGLDMERYRVSLRIKSDCAKIGTRITLNTATSHAVVDTIKKVNYPGLLFIYI